jgi:hypothetical protein
MTRQPSGSSSLAGSIGRPDDPSCPACPPPPSPSAFSREDGRAQKMALRRTDQWLVVVVLCELLKHTSAQTTAPATTAPPTRNAGVA